MGLIAYAVERVVHYDVVKVSADKAQPPTLDPVEELRMTAEALGAYIPDVSDQALEMLLKRFGGCIGLASDALAMQPPPLWVEELLDP